MFKRIIWIVIFCIQFVNAKAVEVPSEIVFAGMELKLTDEVRRKLQADIEMITRSQKSFQLKVDRADLYFPLIEKVFKEENLPDDFKFLSLQESSLVADAISSSNAVGYWQFKKETATEVGLRVDHEVDERMNIVSSSRGAAKYLKKNNTIYFNNWIYSLLAYNTGAGGAKSHIKEKYIGVNKMVIDGNMHWYVIRFLAHKLAYENHVGKNFNQLMVLLPYENCRNKSLKQIADETQIEFKSIEEYNKWLIKGWVPDDKNYCVILPSNVNDKDKILTKVPEKTPKEETEGEVNNKKEDFEINVKVQRKEKKWKVSGNSGSGDVALLSFINRIRAIKAKNGDTPSELAIQGGVGIVDFLRYNDLKSFEQIKPGEYYFLQPKRSKALVAFHTVQNGETIKDVSQKYGIREEAIRSKNRMPKNEEVQQGRVLWLRKKRSENIPIEIKKIEIPQLNKKQEVQQLSKIDTQKITSPIVINEEKIESKSIVVDSNKEYHVVKQGETLYSISKIYASTPDSLKLWNSMESNDIKLGQNLVVKKSIPKENIIEHTVQQGETLYQISKKYNVSVQEIQMWNSKEDIKVNLGEILIIKR